MAIEYLTAVQAADRLGISYGGLMALLESGKLSGLRQGRRVLINPASVDKFLASLPAWESRKREARAVPVPADFTEADQALYAVWRGIEENLVRGVDALCRIADSLEAMNENALSKED